MTHSEPERPSHEEHYAREIRELLEEIKKQNVLLRWYLMLFGIALGILMLLQFESVQNLFGMVLQIVVIVALVMAVLFTAPMWARGVAWVLDRVPWFHRKNPDETT